MEKTNKITNTSFLISRLPLIRRKVLTDQCLDYNDILDTFKVLEETSESDDCSNKTKIEIAIINDNNQYLDCTQIEYSGSDCESGA